MRVSQALALCAMATFAIGASGQEITGTILIKKRLTKPSVTAPVSIYQRGPAIKRTTETSGDPLSYERSRVVIYLEGPDPSGTDAVRSVAQIQQIDRRFSPDQVVVPVGSTVSFPNMDPIFRNIYSLSKPKSFDLGSYDRGETRRVEFPKPGVIEVYCHLHPDMAATIVVTPNRWYARPDPTGQYRIPDVPPGQYTVVAWHKSAGFFRKAIVVEPGHSAVADFFIPLDSDPRQEARTKHELDPRGGTQ